MGELCVGISAVAIRGTSSTVREGSSMRSEPSLTVGLVPRRIAGSADVSSAPSAQREPVSSNNLGGTTGDASFARVGGRDVRAPSNQEVSALKLADCD